MLWLLLLLVSEGRADNVVDSVACTWLTVQGDPLLKPHQLTTQLDHWWPGANLVLSASLEVGKHG